ncbi:MAG TPA: ATP-binding protein [Anaerolineaceae bacterium]|nr:ATP-binding protein [Anaerolineaceae bacterium]
MPASIVSSRSFPAYYSNLAPIAEYTLEFAREFGFTDKSLYAIELALDEACANVIDHGYEGEGKGLIEIELSTDDSEFIIKIEDTGKAFDPDCIPSPDLTSPLDLRCERGLGVFTIRKLMDRVEFKRNKGKNYLLLGKHLA